ncbi:hypothetical protein DPEC_G00015140 [Dallia pectoralis]|uniref:Uncharacterized protein n=1 Tax=Dallia pectoralis TaxID=75939 RepID=A0ACC2HMC3_DALPE|nr:hypothetical protein DPEC_G00015140 [Dallia pectoralis]
MQFQSLMYVVMMILVHIKASFTCNSAEYRIANECCPMCSPGNRVYKHCTEYTSTSCAPCIGSTYIDLPNGLPACLSCTTCDPDFGLMDKQSCRPSSDTVCEPLEGFYCTEPTKDGCKAAQRHSSCKPGQYIRQKGTPSTDTVCSNCTGETYSNGSLTSCQPHTRCVTLNLYQIKPGNHSSDVECGKTNSTAITAGIISAVVIVLLIIGGSIYYLHHLQKINLDCCHLEDFESVPQQETAEVSHPEGQSMISLKTVHCEVNMIGDIPVICGVGITRSP